MPRARRTLTVQFFFAHHFLCPPRSTTRRVVHERNGREGQRKLRARNSARWRFDRDVARNDESRDCWCTCGAKHRRLAQWGLHNPGSSRHATLQLLLDTVADQQGLRAIGRAPASVQRLRIGLDVPGIPECTVEFGALPVGMAVRLVTRPSFPLWLTGSSSIRRLCSCLLSQFERAEA